MPSQASPTNDPDFDGALNLTEFVVGIDPIVSDGIGNAILPVLDGEDGIFSVEIFEKAGHQPGVQIDLDATADMANWIQPWWLRTTNSLPGDPPGSVRELFTTYLPATNVFIVRGVFHLFDAGPETANYYVATNGNNNASGTSTNAPFRSLHKAVSAANPGNLIYVRGGTYTTNATITMNHSGNAANPIRVGAYPGEKPILDFSSTGGTSLDAINLTGSYWELYGLEVVGAPHNGIKIQGSNSINPAGSFNKIERCVFRDCGNTGLQLGSSSSTTFIPHGNLILNCDSYRNYDPPEGEDADGFGVKWNVGTNNVFRGCRAWENSDDGWDLWMAINSVVIENCWAFRTSTNIWNSGSFNGNGNGFKLGGNYVAAPHRIVNCLSFANRTRGFDQNNNMGTLTVDNNTAWNNPTRNFELNHPSTSMPHIVRNNLAVGSGSNTIRAGSVLLSNSWQLVTSPPPGTNDFLSMDTSWAVAPRRDDGGMPEVPFMRPVPGGRLVDRGADLGVAFYGLAPDLGAFETPVW